MTRNHPPTEGNRREQLAAYFLSLPPLSQLSTAARREYLQRLAELGELERREIRDDVGGTRPLVWGNPAPLLQSFLSVAQRLAAGLGQPLLLFPARDAVIGADTLMHPRVLSVTVAAVLREACIAAPRHPVWVRLQEQRGGLAVAVTAEVPFASADIVTLIKQCTKLHGGSLVHCDNTILFTCGASGDPPPGVHLYGCPTEEDLLQDTLSPVWSGFYAGIYSAISGASSSASHSRVSAEPAADSSSSTLSSEGADTTD